MLTHERPYLNYRKTLLWNFNTPNQTLLDLKNSLRLLIGLFKFKTQKKVNNVQTFTHNGTNEVKNSLLILFYNRRYLYQMRHQQSNSLNQDQAISYIYENEITIVVCKKKNVTFRIHLVQNLLHIRLCWVQSKRSKHFSQLCWFNFSIPSTIKKHKSFLVL